MGGQLFLPKKFNVSIKRMGGRSQGKIKLSQLKIFQLGLMGRFFSRCPYVLQTTLDIPI